MKMTRLIFSKPESQVPAAWLVYPESVHHSESRGITLSISSVKPRSVCAHSYLTELSTVSDVGSA